MTEALDLMSLQACAVAASASYGAAFAQYLAKGLDPDTAHVRAQEVADLAAQRLFADPEEPPKALIEQLESWGLSSAARLVRDGAGTPGEDVLRSALLQVWDLLARGEDVAPLRGAAGALVRVLNL